MEVMDVFQLNFQEINKLFCNVISGHGMIAKGHGIFQVTKVTANSYHVRTILTGRPEDGLRYWRMPKELTDLMVGGGLAIPMIRVLEPEEVAKMLLVS